MRKIELSIVIVSFNTKKYLRLCLDSVFLNLKGLSSEVIVVDNGSSDGSVSFLEKLAKIGKIRFIKNSENKGFAAGNNAAISKARGQYILLLNSDTLIQDDIFTPLIPYLAKHSEAGIVSIKLLNKDGSIQGNGGYFPTLIRVFSWMIIQDLPFVDFFIKPFHPLKAKNFWTNRRFYDKERDLDWVTGAFFLVRREVFDEVGLMDEEYFMYTEETDFCYRAKKKGWKVRYIPNLSIIHYGGISGSKEFSVLSEYKGVKRFYKKHYPSWNYPFLILFLKLGALMRMFIMGILEGREAFITYGKAFIKA